jgi:GGDEF domain-containing protein
VPPIVVERPDPRVRELPSWRETRLLDRPTFFDRLQRAVLRNQGAGGGLALLAMKLDPFVMADSGSTWARREEVHMISAGRLIGCLHHTCVTGRIAGDEFAVLAEGISDLRRATGMAEQMLMCVRWPEDLVTASIGIALQGSRRSAEQVMIDADIAMFSARSGGGDRYQVYQEWMRETAVAVPAT